MELSSPYHHIARRLWRGSVLVFLCSLVLVVWWLSSTSSLNATLPEASAVNTQRGPIISPNIQWDTLLIGGLIVVFLLFSGGQSLGQAILTTVGQLHFQRFRFVADRRARRLAGNARLRHWCSQLEALGFSQLGIMSEDTFYGRSVYSLALSAPQARAFASLTRINGRPYYLFYTLLTNGALLLTANGGFREIETPDCNVRNFPKHSINAAWELHLQRVEDFERSGVRSTGDYTAAARLQAAHDFYTQPTVRHTIRRACLKQSASIATVFFLPAVLLSGYLAHTAGLFLPPAQRLGWQTFESPAGSFSIAVPTPPWETLTGNTHDFTATQNRGLIFGVSYTDYSTETRDQAESVLLNTAQQAMLPAGSQLIFAKDVTLSGYPGRAFRFRDSDDLTAAVFVEGRLVLAGQRLYRVTVTYAISSILSPEIDVFLDSFQLVDGPLAPTR